MRFYKWLWRNTLVCSFANMAKYRWKLNRDHKKYDQIMYNGPFKEIVKKYLRIDLSEDWIGRLYGVINPNIDINGKFDPSTMIIEIDGDNTNSNEYVKNWIYKQMSLVSSLFAMNGIYDVITVDIKHVGPAEFDNYLVVFDFDNRQNLAYWRKKVIWRTLIYAAIASILLLVLL